MKYIFAIFALVYISCSSPQKIRWDRTKNENIRHIGASGLDMKIDNATYSFGLTVFSNSTTTIYYLQVSSLWKIEENCLVLLKLGNGETVKLVSENVNVGIIDWPSYSPIIGDSKPSGLISTQKTDYYSSIYLLQKDVLNKIELFGINKIRIQYFNSYKEQNWKKDKLGKHIRKSHELIESQLEITPSQRNSIEDDF